MARPTAPSDRSDFVVSYDGEAELVSTPAGRRWKRRAKVEIPLDDPDVYSIRAMTPRAHRWLQREGIKAFQPRGDIRPVPGYDALAILTPLGSDAVQALSLRLLSCGFTVNGFDKRHDSVGVTLN